MIIVDKHNVEVLPRPENGSKNSRDHFSQYLARAIHGSYAQRNANFVGISNLG